MAAPSGWMRRIVVSLITLALLLAGAGFLYQNISVARDRRFNPMPGRMVDANGLKMHIYCTGEGSPAVILDSGLGETYVSWRKVQPEIAKFARVCSYDRAGLGYSDSSSRPRTSRVVAEELHALLEAAGVAPPYVVVGHSAGGYNMRVFTGLYRSEVAGMVLVDASHPDQENRFPAELRSLEGSWQREAEFVEYSMPFGVPRLLGFCGADPVQRAAACTFASVREGSEEMNQFKESAAEAAAAGTLGDMPLAVLSHDPDKLPPDLPADVAKATNEAWEKMQEELAHLSSRGTQTIAKNSAHYIQMDRPELVIEAVRTVWDQTRAAQTALPSKP